MRTEVALQRRGVLVDHAESPRRVDDFAIKLRGEHTCARQEADRPLQVEAIGRRLVGERVKSYVWRRRRGLLRGCVRLLIGNARRARICGTLGDLTPPVALLPRVTRFAQRVGQL
eukprot:3043985-Pleurochrysis_carterae.AAC.1